MKFTAFVLTLALSGPVAAQVFTQGWAFGIGAFQHNMLELAADKTGKADALGETYLPIGLQYATSVGPSWRFVPSLNITHLTTLLLPKETPEEGAKKNLIFLNLPFVTALTPNLDGKIGLGVFRYEIKGEGGTVVLNNGGGTATYYKPDESRAAHSTYMLLGLAFPMVGWQLDLDFQVGAPLSEDRRNYSMFLYITKPLTGAL